MVETTKIDTTIQTRDGRALTFRDWGDRSGRPVFYLHGGPGSRLLRGPDLDDSRLGVRLITYDRPGYGRSNASRDARWSTRCLTSLTSLTTWRWRRSAWSVSPVAGRPR